MGVTDVTFYRWKKIYANFGVAEIWRLKQLEDDNRRLKQLVADLTLDKQMLQDVLAKKLQGLPIVGNSSVRCKLRIGQADGGRSGGRSQRTGK